MPRNILLRRGDRRNLVITGFCQRGAVSVDLLDRLDDVVYLPAVGQQHRLLRGDGRLTGWQDTSLASNVLVDSSRVGCVLASTLP